MPRMPIPDYDGDLWTGDRIDPDQPPSHCGYPLTRYDEGDGYGFECHGEDYQLHTDSAGVLTEPPHITD
jgi:hypothetical protein